eukprot:2329-Heterococcus_DN1.PRE.2
MVEELSTPAEAPLAPSVLRGLGDRSYDKRKNAALEIEALVKSLQDAHDTDRRLNIQPALLSTPMANTCRNRICSIIALLGQDFATSTNANHRKGGLIGLAATAIGLMSSTKLYLDALLPPVLHCLDDPESRVRYYACESLYNIAKVARQDMLTYFNQIFDGLCKLFADVDVDVKNGSNLLDRLIKDIVTESESFDVERFIPLLQKYIRRTNPYIRQLLVGWITVLDSVPDINMIDWHNDSAMSTDSVTVVFDVQHHYTASVAAATATAAATAAVRAILAAAATTAAAEQSTQQLTATAAAVSVAAALAVVTAALAVVAAVAAAVECACCNTALVYCWRSSAGVSSCDRCSTHIAKGCLVCIRGTLQQGDPLFCWNELRTCAVTYLLLQHS